MTYAESVKTNKNIVLPAAGALRLVDEMNSSEKVSPNNGNKMRMDFAARDSFNTMIISKNVA